MAQTICRTDQGCCLPSAELVCKDRDGRIVEEQRYKSGYQEDRGLEYQQSDKTNDLSQSSEEQTKYY